MVSGLFALVVPFVVARRFRDSPKFRDATAIGAGAFSCTSGLVTLCLAAVVAADGTRATLPLVACAAPGLAQLAAGAAALRHRPDCAERPS